MRWRDWKLRERRAPRPWARRLTLLVCVAAALLPGCRSLDLKTARTIARISSLGRSQTVSVRKKVDQPLATHWHWFARGGPTPTPRTRQFLRRFDLENTYRRSADEALQTLIERTEAEPTLEATHVLAELAFLEGETSRIQGQRDRALRMLATALIASYRYLFDPSLLGELNSYDPEFRRTCDIYNQSLAGLLRIINHADKLRPGSVHTVDLFGVPIEFRVQIDGRWDPDDLSRFEFVSDYRTQGLKNHYNTYGLGVPLIAVREATTPSQPWEQYYPIGIAFPVTAFLELAPQPAAESGAPRQRCVLHLYDPLQHTALQVGQRLAPLESDVTTPLAYFLNDPLLNTNVLPTFSLLNADLVKDFRGLYMLEPFDPHKIPVVMVHGLWSTPVTWTEMFNDLRAMPEIRRNYQFWFYLYPTGQPFWVSARQMRDDLARVFQTLDPRRESARLHEMVLVGHSMGGLVSRLQTLESRDEFWQLVSESPLSDLKGDAKSVEELAALFFFDPNPSVKRVITIGTPHRGSAYANNVTQWLGRRLFSVSDILPLETDRFKRDNAEVLKDDGPLSITTSIESLAPESQFFSAMLDADSPPWITYHNIIGHLEKQSLIAQALHQETGDGVVGLSSARVDDVASELEVAAAHQELHQHPLAILEVRRILLEHLEGVARAEAARGLPRDPTSSASDASLAGYSEPLPPRPAAALPLPAARR